MKACVCVSIAFFLMTAAADKSTLRDEDKSVIESFISAQARQERGEEYLDARAIVLGDVNHDGIADVVVLYTIEGQGGGNNYVQYLAVFLRRSTKLVGISHASVGGKSSRSVELTTITNNEIRLQTLSYAATDPTCCPTLKGATRYVLNNGKLMEK
jgi:hypothetical protein